MKLGVVVPTFNRRDSLRQALDSLLPQLDSNDLVIVVDSAALTPSPAGTVETPSRIVRIGATDDNWWTGATNIGIAEALRRACTHVLTFNDDNIACPDLVARLKEVLVSHPRSIVSAVCCYRSVPSRVFFAGRVRARWTDRFHYLNHNQDVSRLPGGVRSVDLLHGMCTAFPSSVFTEIGAFDDDAFPHLFADDDLALRAAKAGYQLLVALDARVLNDRELTGLNVYRGRLSVREAVATLFSQKSVFQLSRRTRFLWRHRTGTGKFVLTWFADYLRLAAIIVLGWILPKKQFRRLMDGA